MRTDRWEYKVEDVKSGFMFSGLKSENLTDALNREGMQGWELINVVSIGAATKLFFKRPR